MEKTMAETRIDAKTYGIGLYAPVYVVSDKKSFKEYCINAGEWIFDFSSSSFSVEKINEKRKIQLCDQKNWIGRGIQVIALIAVLIIFPLGICLAYLKYSHHAELVKPEKVVAAANAGQSVKSEPEGKEVKSGSSAPQIAKIVSREQPQENITSTAPAPDLFKPVTTVMNSGTSVKSESEDKEVKEGSLTSITTIVSKEHSQESDASKTINPDLLKSEPVHVVDQFAANPIHNIDLQEPIHENWLWSNAIRIKEQPWDKSFLTMRELMFKNNAPLLLFSFGLPHDDSKKHGAYGVYMGFMLKVKHEKGTLDEDTVVGVVRYSNRAAALLKNEFEEINFESESHRVLFSFSGKYECLQMSREKAIQYSKITQQSCLPLEEQKSLTWLLYNVIEQKQSVKISELGAFVDESITNPKANWEVRLATPEEVKESYVKRKAKREAAQIELEGSITDKLTKAPIINFSAEQLLDDIHAEMMNKKLSIAQFRDGSIAFMLDVKHIDLKTQPNYHRVPKVEKPIVLIMLKQNEFEWKIPDDDSYEDIYVVQQKLTEEANGEAKENQERIAKGQEPVAPIIKRYCYGGKIFRHFLGAHSLKIQNNEMEFTFLTFALQDQLPKEYQKSLAWIVYRLLNDQSVALCENQVPVKLFAEIPSKPWGYWKLSLAKF